MRCNKCNQESIVINNGHILCEICGLDIDVSCLDEDGLFDLFFYNKNLDEAEKLGEEAVSEGKELGDNPYSLDAEQLMLHNRWVKGYNREKESYDIFALSLSAEKNEEAWQKERVELLEEIKTLSTSDLVLFKENEVLKLHKERVDVRVEKLEGYFDLLAKKRYIWGKSYRNDLKEIMKYIHKK